MNIEIKSTGRVRISGLETGKLTLLTLQRRYSQWFAILKIGGHHYWGGVGQGRPYAPMAIAVVEMKSVTVTGNVERDWTLSAEIDYPFLHEFRPTVDQDEIRDVVKALGRKS